MIFVFLGVALLFRFVLEKMAVQEESNFIILMIMALVLFIIVSFATLNVAINEKYLRIRFGYGVFGKKFLLTDIDSTSIVKNKWYYGWGIRFWFWPRMMIFNISGFDAVELKMKNGKIFRIGTDEPGNLKRVISEAISIEDRK